MSCRCSCLSGGRYVIAGTRSDSSRSGHEKNRTAEYRRKNSGKGCPQFFSLTMTAEPGMLKACFQRYTLEKNSTSCR